MSRTTLALPSGQPTRTFCAAALAILASAALAAPAAFAAEPARAYELVTPAGSSRAEPVAVHPFKGGDGFGYRSIDGQLGALEGVWTGYNAERTPEGWTNTRLGAGAPLHYTHGATNARFPVASQPLGYSADGRTTWLLTMLPLVPEDENTALADPLHWGGPGAADIYAITDGKPVLITRDAAGKAAGLGFEVADTPSKLEQFVAADGNKLVFTLRRADSQVIKESGPDPASIFIASPDGDVQLVDSFAPTGLNSVRGRPISDDGTRLLYSKANQLTLWDAGVATDLGPLSGVPHLSGDGTTVTWTGAQGADPFPRLRRYDVASGATTLLSDAFDASPPTVAPGLIDTSDDGQTVVFSTLDQLTADTPAPGTSGVPNYYAYTGGALHYIARSQTWGSVGTAGNDRARTTNSGQVFFATASALLPADTDATGDLYRWSAAAGLELLSVSATGGNAAEPAIFGSPESVVLGLGEDFWGMPAQRARFSENISSDGRWAFFTSAEKLTADAGDNGRTKVYAWHDGDVVLISAPGADAREARYLNNSATGRDAFIVTDQVLDPRDTDGLYTDIYNARIGGGFPLPAPAVDPCPGNACALPVPGAAAAPVTTTINPSGNPAAGGDATPAGDPSNRFSFKGKASTKLKLVAPGEGRFSISAKAKVGKRTKTVLNQTVRATKAGTRTVKLQLNRSGRSALKRTKAGRLKLKVRVTFEPAGGFTRTRTVTVTFTTKSSKR